MSIDFLNIQLKRFCALNQTQKQIIALLRQDATLRNSQLARAMKKTITAMYMHLTRIYRHFDIREKTYKRKREVLLALVNLVFASPYKI